MKSEDLLELIKVLGIAYGAMISATAIVFKWLQVLPEKWREASAGRTALIRLENMINENEDRCSDDYKEVRKELSDQIIINSQNWVKFMELQKLQSK